uniref:Caspase family p10 domain-containing protein n=1 Tax=Amphimedon queenslandica TaxID=400682 RepID=A0A1X7STM9_AMPQE
TCPGYVLWRNSGYGTWFIKAFVDIRQNRASGNYFMNILIEVNRIIAEKNEHSFKK